jgi:hypothetical protein
VPNSRRVSISRRKSDRKPASMCNGSSPLHVAALFASAAKVLIFFCFLSHL